MKKRLRKKLHLKEFKEFGFEVIIHHDQSLSAEQQVDMLDHLIDFMEANNYQVGGSAEGAYITKRKGSINEQERQSIIEAIGTIEGVLSVTASPLTDAWHDKLTF